jgi:ATP-binding cassette subfamily G (WHITE) protein 2
MVRERAAGTYYVSAYFLAKTLADMCVQIISPIIFTIIAYPMIGFQNERNHFMTFLGFMIMDSFAATSLGNMIACVFVSIELSTVVLALGFEWCRLFGGWFISPIQISSYPAWKFADALSFIKYAFIGVSLNEYNGLVLHCLPSERTGSVTAPESAANCKIPPLVSYPYNGAAYNSFYGYEGYTIEFCAGMLLVYIVVCRVIAYLGLRYIKRG